MSGGAANYVGPVGWTVPEEGKLADWQCIKQLGQDATLDAAKLNAKECITNNYIPSLTGAGFRGLVLFHGNLLKKVMTRPSNGGQPATWEDFY